MDKNDKTLYDLKTGDSVILISPSFKSIKNVSRLTKNYVVIGNTKFRKSDGFMTGNIKHYTQRIVVGTDNEIENVKCEIVHNDLVRKVNTIPFQSLTNEQLDAILDIAKS